MRSANQAAGPSYSINVPALNEFEMDVRREGESRMTQRWIGTSVDPLGVPDTDNSTGEITYTYVDDMGSQPIPNVPYRPIDVIQNTEFRVGVRRTENGVFYPESTPANVIRWMVRFPELRQMVWSLNDDSLGYSNTVPKQTTPVIDLHVTATQEWVQYLRRHGVYYINLHSSDESGKADNRLSWRMQCHKTELTAFEVEEDLFMATVMLTPFAVYAPSSGVTSTLSVTSANLSTTGDIGYIEDDAGAKASGDGFVPGNISKVYYDSSANKVVVSVPDGEKWPDLWPLESISIGTEDPINMQFIVNPARDGGEWRSVEDITSNPLTTGTHVVTFNYFWVADRFADIRMNNTGIASL